MFVGAYFGVGLVLVTQMSLDALDRGLGTSVPDAAYLSIPFLISFFVVSALRVAFDIPAAIQSNWVFQITVDAPHPEPRQVAIRLLLWATIPWQVLVLTPATALRFGWSMALLHTATVLACTIVFIEGILLRFRKIPFTCSSQLEIRQLLVRALAAIFAVLFFVPAIARTEHWALNEPVRLIGFAAVILMIWYLLRRYTREMIAEDRILRFEDSPNAAFELIKLT